MSDVVATTSRMPLLMPDDFSELHLCGWRVEAAEPDPENPLIEGETPWDRGGVGICSSVFKDPINGRWKAYTVCTPEDEFPEKNPEIPDKPWGSQNHSYRRICLFESDDGVHWTRPQLANVPCGDHKTTNIIFGLDAGTSLYSSILIDPDSPWPYRMMALRESWMPGRGKPPEGNGYYPYRSKDGYKWEAAGGKLCGPFDGWDVCLFYRIGGVLTPFPLSSGESPPEEKYICFYRLSAQRRPTDHLPPYEDGARRSVYRATSRDGLTWVKDELMELTNDERDHRDTQYQECMPLKVPGGYIALVTMYLPITQTLNLRMAASRDGRRWWFPDRRPCLDNGPLGDYGGGMIWQSQYLIVQDGRLYLYYGATESLHRQISDTRAPSVEVNYLEKVLDHGAHFLPFTSALCRSSWQFDRMYALASSTGGTTFAMATTVSKPLGGQPLSINLATRPAKKAAQAGLDEGMIQVELLDQSQRPIAGFSREDCDSLRGNHKQLRVKWKGGAVAPPEARHAKFYLKRAFLYGFVFGTAP